MQAVQKFLRSGPVPTEAEIVAQLEAIDDWDLSLGSKNAVMMARRALRPDFAGVMFEGNYLPFLQGKVQLYFEKLYAPGCLDAAKQTLWWYRSEGKFWSEVECSILRYFTQKGVRPSLFALDGVGPVFEALQPLCRILLNDRFRDRMRTPQLDEEIRKAFTLALQEHPRL